MCYETECIVLKKHEIGDYGILAIVFTKDFGKITIANNMLRRHENYGGLLDIISHNEISFLETNNPDNIYNLIRIDNIDKFSNIYNDLNKILAVLKPIEIISECLPEKEKHEDIFNLLLDLINTINTENSNTYSWNTIIFYICLLKEMGYLLCFTHCVCCGQEELKSYKISFLQGGILCNHCAIKYHDNISIPKDIYFYLKSLAGFDYNLIKKIKPNQKQIYSIQNFLERYFEYILSKPLKVRNWGESLCSLS